MKSVPSKGSKRFLLTMRETGNTSKQHLGCKKISITGELNKILVFKVCLQLFHQRQINNGNINVLGGERTTRYTLTVRTLALPYYIYLRMFVSIH